MQHPVFTFILSNFPLVMCISAIIIAALNPYNFNRRLYFCMLLFGVGFSGIWGFVMHALFSQIASQNIGWKPSQFEFEVALANLALGIGGLIAAFASSSYKAAIVTITTIFLWGAAGGHIYQIIQSRNFNPGNAGSILWTDMLIPLILIFLAFKIHNYHDKNIIYYN